MTDQPARVMLWKTHYLLVQHTVQLTVSGPLELAHFRHACSEALGAARKSDSRKVLVDSRDMNTSRAVLELLSLPAALRGLALTQRCKVAVVQPPCPKITGLFAYFERQFSNERSTVRFFPDLARASVWLAVPMEAFESNRAGLARPMTAIPKKPNKSKSKLVTMKTRLTSTAALILAPLALAALSGCATGPSKGVTSGDNPSMTGGWRVVEKTKYKATIESIDAKQRVAVLAPKEGSPVSCKFGPDVLTYDQFNSGDKVKAKVATESAIFLVKSGPPPSAGQGAWARPKGDTLNGGGVLLTTADTTATVLTVDRSYRMLKLTYADGTTKEIKVDLPASLAFVQPGDQVVVRRTQPMIVAIKSKHRTPAAAGT